MSTDEIMDRVLGVVERNFKDKLGSIQLTTETSLFSGTELSSGDAIELVVELENEFGIFFNDDDLDISQLQTVSSAARIIDKLMRLKERGGEADI